MAALTAVAAGGRPVVEESELATASTTGAGAAVAAARGRRFTRGVDPDVAAHVLLRADPRPRSRQPRRRRQRAGGRGHRRRGRRDRRARRRRRVAPPGRRRPCPRRWTTLPAGATFGSLVHGVLEHADPRAPDLARRARRPVEEQRAGGRSSVDARRARRRPRCRCSTPRSGRSPAAAPCARSACADRLRELDFELPLAGGDRRRRRRRSPRRAGAAAPRAPARPTTRCCAYADRARVPGAWRTAAARLPHRVDRRGAPRAGRGPTALPRRRLQDEPAGRPRRPLTALDYRPTCWPRR